MNQPKYKLFAKIQEKADFFAKVQNNNGITSPFFVPLALRF
jgi:hypothetical protein